MEKPVVKVNLNCAWGPAKTDGETLVRQITDLMQRLRSIHSLFNEISNTGKKNGFSSMLDQPVVWSLTPSDWHSLLEENRGADDVVRVSFWNRRSLSSEFVQVTVHANDVVVGNGVTLNGLPGLLNNDASITAIMRAFIEVFQPVQTLAYTFWQDEEVWARCWKVWMAEHAPLGQNPYSQFSSSQFSPAQGPQSDAEPWLGGTLYTWPEYEPWRYEGPAKS